MKEHTHTEKITLKLKQCKREWQTTAKKLIPEKQKAKKKHERECIVPQDKTKFCHFSCALHRKIGTATKNQSIEKMRKDCSEKKTNTTSGGNARTPSASFLKNWRCQERK